MIAPLGPTAEIYKLTVAQAMSMRRSGIFEDPSRVELVGGVPIDLPAVGPAHADAVVEVAARVAASVGDRWQVRVQDVLATDEHGFVLPDVAVVDVAEADAPAGSALLVVEVAEATGAREREKVWAYAELRVAEYWIVDLAAATVTVHREPSGPSLHPRHVLPGYGSIATHRDGAVTPGVPNAEPVALDALLGR